METREFKGFEVSKLVVGGVQFGYTYGIANRVGQPSYESVLEIVERAFSRGGNALDTAAMYGESEVLLGRVLDELGLKEKAFVTTKVHAVKGYAGNAPREVLEFVRDSVAASLKALGLDSVPLCLLHRAEDLFCLDELLRLREEGLIRHAGISVYSPAAALAAISTPGVDAIQCPVSLFDQRFQREGVLAQAREKGIAIFARSIYLQGLMALGEEEIPGGLEPIKPLRKALEVTAASLDISLMELALRFVNSLEEVTGLVVGMESVEQLESNLDFFDKTRLAPEVMETIVSQVPDLSETILIPGLWPTESN